MQSFDSVVAVTSSNLSIFNLYTSLAMLGGFVLNVIHLLEHTKHGADDKPDFRDWFYWFPFIAWPVLAGILVYVAQLSNITDLSFLINPLGVPITIPGREFSAFTVGLTCPMIYDKIMRGSNNVLFITKVAS